MGKGACHCIIGELNKEKRTIILMEGHNVGAEKQGVKEMVDPTEM